MVQVLLFMPQYILTSPFVLSSSYFHALEHGIVNPIWSWLHWTTRKKSRREKHRKKVIKVEDTEFNREIRIHEKNWSNPICRKKIPSCVCLPEQQQCPTNNTYVPTSLSSSIFILWNNDFFVLQKVKRGTGKQKISKSRHTTSRGWLKTK